MRPKARKTMRGCRRDIRSGCRRVFPLEAPLAKGSQASLPGVGGSSRDFLRRSSLIAECLEPDVFADSLLFIGAVFSEFPFFEFHFALVLFWFLPFPAFVVPGRSHLSGRPLPRLPRQVEPSSPVSAQRRQLNIHISNTTSRPGRRNCARRRVLRCHRHVDAFHTSAPTQ